ncbi:hypothetical protein XHV734_1318 [Xanthomonas hortorum pv. vitians]|nr:hypothetical protein XHV734_1318 [Xanthomonas hortorum pv. vitians]
MGIGIALDQDLERLTKLLTPVHCRPADLLPGCRALARPPSQDTPQVHPCRLLRGIHAA